MLSGVRVALRAGALLAAAVLCAACTTPQRAEQGKLVIQVANASGEAAAKADAKPLHGAMEVGQRLEIRLGANAGTGYVWRLAGPAPANMAMDSTDPAGVVTPAPGADGKPGAGTITTFAMTAISQGDAKLRFTLLRPWEKQTQPDRRVDIHVTVSVPEKKKS